MLPLPSWRRLWPAAFGAGAVLLVMAGYCAVRIVSLQPPPEHLSVSSSADETLVVSGAGFEPAERVTLRTTIDQTSSPVSGIADDGGRFTLDSGRLVTLDCRMSVSVDAASINLARSKMPFSRAERKVDPGGFAQLAFGYTVYPRGDSGQLVLLPMNDPKEKRISASAYVIQRVEQAPLFWTIGGWLLLGILPLGFSVRVAKRTRRGQQITSTGAVIAGVLLALVTASVLGSLGVGMVTDAYQHLVTLARTCPNTAIPMPDAILAALGVSLAEVRQVAAPGSIVVVFGALFSRRTQRVALVLLPVVLGIAVWGALGGHGFSAPPTQFGQLLRAYAVYQRP